MATTESSDQSIGLPNQILLKPWNISQEWNMYPLDGQEQPKNFENLDFGIDLKSTQWSRQHCVLQATD